MLSHIKTPSGDLIARVLIQRVSHIPKRGVVVNGRRNLNPTSSEPGDFSLQKDRHENIR